MGSGPKHSPYTTHFGQLEDPQSTKYLHEEIATRKEHTKLKKGQTQTYGTANNAIINQCLISLSISTAEYMLLLYISLLCLFQAEAVSYAKQFVRLMDSVLMAGKATVERNKELKMGASLMHKTVIKFH
ncbi:hypothetical protein VNO78_13995 [Psophocarpus tetragonolobus]|uniref:Uncharacterized protein n=1 Tax=Psophocarpus tetragonolobus TaxID=3891 RepID=A0AAN9XQ63_PSOTE